MKELTVELKHIAPGQRATAVYFPHEEHDIRRHIANAEKRGTPREEIDRELEFLHLMKATFEAVLVP